MSRNDKLQGIHERRLKKDEGGSKRSSSEALHAKETQFEIILFRAMGCSFSSNNTATRRTGLSLDLISLCFCQVHQSLSPSNSNFLWPPPPARIAPLCLSSCLYYSSHASSFTLKNFDMMKKALFALRLNYNN